MRVVLFANAKGGCGKTTLATTFATLLAAARRRVALADADPQRSALSWLARRPDRAARITALDWTRAEALGRWPDGVKPKKLDWLVIDSPAGARAGRAAHMDQTGASTEAQSAAPPELDLLLACADVVVAPVLPSTFDAGASLAFLSRLENHARVRRGGLDIVVAINRARTAGLATQALEDALRRAGRAPATAMPDRAAYANLAAHGLALFDRPRRVDPEEAERWRALLVAIGGGELAMPGRRRARWAEA